MSLVQGIHHICIKCPDDAAFQKTRAFYTEILGLPVYHEWGNCVLLGHGTDNIEVIKDEKDPLPKGVLQHIAFDVTDTDKLAALIREAGYQFFIEPQTVKLGTDPCLECRIAFCYGPMGEEIELFQTIRK